MPFRILNVQVRPSGLSAYFSATLPFTLPCWSKTSSKSYMDEPQLPPTTIGSIDSFWKSATATRRVPLGAAAGAVVGAAAAAGAVGFAAAAGAVVGAAGGLVGAAAGAL